MLSPKQQQTIVNVVGSSTFGRYPKISLEKTYNMFISDEWLVDFAGYKKIKEFDSKGYGRGAFRSIRNNIVVTVIGSSVFVVDRYLNETFVGNIKSAIGNVFMAENLNNQIAIVDGINIYIYNHAIGSITVQTLQVNLIPNYVVYHNTFFLIGNNDRTSNGAAWYAFKYESPTTITNQTQLALQTKSDYAIAVETLPGGGNNVIVFGTSVCEIWTQIGGIENYQRNSSVNIDFGCLSVSTIASSDKYVMWLGINEDNSPAITLFAGNQVLTISTDGIDYVLGNLINPEKSSAFFYRVDGHLFYQITFYDPEDNLTLIYDVDTKKFFHVSDAHLNYHPANKVVYFNNKVYFVSLNNNCFYEMSTNYPTYDENLDARLDEKNLEIPRIRICSNIRSQDASRFRSRNLSLTLQQGEDRKYTRLDTLVESELIISQEDIPLITQEGDYIISEGSFENNFSIDYKPRVDLSLSKDGSITFSNTVGMDLNPIGYRKNMLRWQRQFGMANDLVFKFRFWGKCHFVVNNATLDLY